MIVSLTLQPILSNSQFGFFKRNIFTTAAIENASLFLNLERRHHSDIVYMDFRKAFDSLSHKILLEKIW